MATRNRLAGLGRDMFFISWEKRSLNEENLMNEGGGKQGAVSFNPETGDKKAIVVQQNKG